jgi:ADP-ribose pyrophosphatase YjhB (NUDIX family)
MNIGIDYIGVSAGAIIKNNEEQYFLAKRGEKARDDQGLWEFPGGTINFYETREQAAKRNIYEKYHFEIGIDGLLGVYDVIDKIHADHWISTTYLCHVVQGTPQIMDKKKCADIRWFTLEEIKTLPISRISQLNLLDLLRITKNT